MQYLWLFYSLLINKTLRLTKTKVATIPNTPHLTQGRQETHTCSRTGVALKGILATDFKLPRTITHLAMRRRRGECWHLPDFRHSTISTKAFCPWNRPAVAAGEAVAEASLTPCLSYCRVNKTGLKMPVRQMPMPMKALLRPTQEEE